MHTSFEAVEHASIPALSLPGQVAFFFFQLRCQEAVSHLISLDTQSRYTWQSECDRGCDSLESPCLCWLVLPVGAPQVFMLGPATESSPPILRHV